LDSAGLIIDVPTKVLTAPLSGILLEEPEVGVVVLGSPWDDWFAAYQKFTGFDKRKIAVRKSIIHRISAQKAFAAAVIDEDVMGIGLGVVDGDWLGLFSMITEEKYRRQHVATTVTKTLVGWGLSQGASRGYLQVEESNTPARQLYYGVGFKDTYKYWYRVDPE
jgi:GNAT superfamily N-acetyltransferase